MASGAMLSAPVASFEDGNGYVSNSFRRVFKAASRAFAIGVGAD